jgi:hypothetical protein
VVVVSAIFVCRNSPYASVILEDGLLVSHWIEGVRGVVSAAVVEKEAGPSERLQVYSRRNHSVSSMSVWTQQTSLYKEDGGAHGRTLFCADPRMSILRASNGRGTRHAGIKYQSYIACVTSIPLTSVTEDTHISPSLLFFHNLSFEPDDLSITPMAFALWIRWTLLQD